MIFHNYFVFELRISKLRILNISREIDLLKFSYLLFCLEVTNSVFRENLFRFYVVGYDQKKVFKSTASRKEIIL